MTDITFSSAPLAVGKSWWKLPERVHRAARASFDSERSSTDRASFQMLRLYRSNLEVRLQSIDEAALQTNSQRRTHALVGEMLSRAAEASADRESDWDQAYKMERMISLLLSGGQLRHEIQMRLDELAAEGAAEAASLRAEYDALVSPVPGQPSSPADDAAVSSFLLRVMEVLHRNAKKKNLARPIRKEATKGILLFGIMAFLLALAPYVVINIDFVEGLHLSPWWSLFALYTAVVSGLLGAFFSRLIMMQRDWARMSLDEVFLHREFTYTLLRAGVGMGGAVIVYFFLKSGLVDGALFPHFDKLAMEWVRVPDGSMSFVVPSKDLALMTFWCFLAGFSEVLVPNMLSSTERQLFNDGGSAKLSGR
jgi:hypothetical protein